MRLLLWSGGFDSTFELLRMLSETETDNESICAFHVREGGPCQYGRYKRELASLDRIQAAIAAHSPRWNQRLRVESVVLPDKHSLFYVPEYASAVRKYGRVLGNQYDRFIFFARLRNYTDLNVCIESNVTGPSPTADVFKPWVDRQTLRLDTERCPDELELFAPLRFPVLFWNRDQMAAWLAERNMSHFANLVWSCDLGMDKPCEKCHSCLTKKNPLVL